MSTDKDHTRKARLFCL